MGADTPEAGEPLRLKESPVRADNWVSVSVDMHEWKFISELRRLPPFQPGGPIDRDVRKVDFPAWRAIFSSMTLWGHSTGYRLPSFEQFADYCEKAYTHPSHKGRFSRWFAGDGRDRARQRLAFWYESGVAETYLYVCLVDALEDVLREGVVLYDPRADWKLKCDIAVLLLDSKISVDSYWGSGADRADIKAWRSDVERVRKINTAQSSHWSNKELERWTTLEVRRDETHCQVINGLRLFSIEAVNDLLTAIYDEAELPADRRFSFPTSEDERRDLYRRLVR